MFIIVKLVISVLVLVVILRELSSQSASVFLKSFIAFVFCRLVLASNHELSFPPIVGSFSLISLCTILFFLYFMFILYFSNRSYKVYIQRKLLLAIIALMILSGLINGNLSLGIPEIIKWSLLYVLLLVLSKALIYDGLFNVIKSVRLLMMLPILLLLASFLIGEVKATENDGSASFVGGYYHEAVFSIVVFTALIVNAFYYRLIESNNILKQLVIPTVLVLLLFLVNYRTTMISAVIFFAFYLMYLFSINKTRLSKFVVPAILFAVLSVSLVSEFNQVDNENSRFRDIGLVINKVQYLSDYPEYYSFEEKRYFSGRVYAWNRYLYEYADHGLLENVIGLGMNSWKDYFNKYAHNTFVSAIFEIGIIGLLLLLLFFFKELLTTLTYISKPDQYLVFGALISFILLNIGTMPLWQIEGILLLVIILTYKDEIENSLVHKTGKVISGDVMNDKLQ